MSEPKETKCENSPEAYVLVMSVAKQVNKLILKELAGIGQNMKWLLYSRIVNLLFWNHYRVTLGAAQDKVKEARTDGE